MRTASLILFGLLICRSAGGQALEERPAGAAGLALAGAGVSSLDRPSVLWLNPARLPAARLRLLVELQLQSDTGELTRTDVVNQPATARDLQGPHLSPGLTIAHPLGLRWLWAGIGYRLARLARSRYAEQELLAGKPSRAAPGRYLGSELSLEQHVVALGLGAACRWGGLGASLELSHLRLGHRRALWAGTAGDRQLLEDARLDVGADLRVTSKLTPGALLGIWASTGPWLQLGLALRLPITASLEGELALQPGPRAPAGFETMEARPGEARLELPLPLSLRGGVSLGPPRWRLLLEASYQRWSQADQLAAGSDAALLLSSAQGQAIQRRALLVLPLGLGLTDTYSLHAALELVPLPGRLILRTGYAFHRGGTRAALPTPVLLDLDRHVWGAGLELRAGRLSLGLAMAQHFEASLRIDDSRVVLLNPIETGVTTMIGAGRYQSSRLRVVFEAGLSWD